LKVAIHGAAGRMGQRLIALGSADPSLEIVAAIESSGRANLGSDAGVEAGIGNIGIPLSYSWPQTADAVVDFSIPEATPRLIEECVKRGQPVVFATTGLSAREQQSIEAAAEVIPIVKAASMSLAVNLTMKLVEIATSALKDNPQGVDIEIIERHHRFKEDSPSGTALAFGNIVAGALGDAAHVHGRSGRPGQRPRNEIGYHAIRAGDNPGEHTILFGLLGESIELRVAATSRDCYAQGALVAARWLQGKPPGLYSMQDVLGLRS
jgi:4-hydroxy-tetrahydrodipicolinate reductase